MYRQAIAASVDTHFPQENMRPMVKNATTVGLWDISPTSTGDPAGSTEKATTMNVTTLPRKTGDGLETIPIGTVTLDP